jgi:hypothetical protein
MLPMQGALSGAMADMMNWADDVKRLYEPVMLVWGDSDMFRPEHMIERYKLLGGGQRDTGWQRDHMSNNRLAMIPNVTTTSSPHRRSSRRYCRFSTARRPRRAGLRKS